VVGFQDQAHHIVDRLRILGLAEQFAVLDQMPNFSYVDEARAAAIA
jgi:hypothetical protein